ncbi:MAG: NAD(P)H-dependent glycerol-3-phosphate dehydrogenase [Deltaproteobacteria bacterium]|jgi:glycerol-3-phosphate dehydrogenase (NAD(P)+)|nr:NAD(P)H-dependent glycerol-3-phosphate dehydrogenase [Deltaproteobacteria bacterium]
MRLRVAVLGAGSFGTTIAHLATHNAPTTLWCRRAETADEINREHTNERYLPGYAISPELRATASLEEAVQQADVLVLGVPSHGIREVLGEVARHIRPWVPVVSLAKGLERDTHLRMTEVIRELLPDHRAGVLTGPNLAKEIMAGYAAASVISFEDQDVAQQLQAVFHSGGFRVYTNQDVIGCELGGALKNVIAIATGMGDGLGVGDNTRSAVITRGLAELTRLGVAMGGQPATFAGLAGMGDLIATCTSKQSRNRHVGEELGKGRTIDEIIAAMNQVAEGVKTTRVVMELGAKHDVTLPISAEVNAVIHEGRTAQEAYRGLGRQAGAEHEPG